MRYFIHLAYDGTRYHGWQIQPNGISVEGEIERCLSTILRTPIDIVGAGRTDAGVHARHMVAHMEYPPSPPSGGMSVPACLSPSDIPPDGGLGGYPGESLVYKLNRMLPPDIVIYKIEPVADDMHARFSAVSRTYHYYICTKPDPFNRHYTWLCHYDLDFPLMNEAAQILLEYKDFACFCKSHTDVKTTLCDIMEARWCPLKYPPSPPLGGMSAGTTSPQFSALRAERPSAERGGMSAGTTSPQFSALKAERPSAERGGMSAGVWYFRIKANRFLRNMVRAVVGTLVEVGRHRMTLEEFRMVIEGRKRTQAGESMPANALFLEEVEYK